jgi:hypothetical protein
MKARKLIRFCAAAELTLVEAGKVGEHPGFWFFDRKGKRVFVGESEIHERLERRKSSLFGAAKAAEPAVAVAAVVAAAE